MVASVSPRGVLNILQTSMKELSYENNQRLLVQSRFLILENSIFVTPAIAQTLNINNLRSRSAKSISLHTIRKLIKYSLKKVRVKAVFIVTVFETLLFEGTSVLSPAQRGTGRKRVKLSSP